MTTALKKQLYNYVPGFKTDRDEEWACYLPRKDAKFLTNKRRQFLELMDTLDGYKLDLKDNASDGQRTAELSAKISDLTKQIDAYIKVLLDKVVELRARGLKVREDRIAADMGVGPSNVDEMMDFTSDTATEALGLESLARFMPRFDPPVAAATASRAGDGQSTATGANQDQADQEIDMTYLEGVDEADVEIMEKMRSDVQRFKCRDMVLEILGRFRVLDSRVDLIENDLKEIERNTRKRVATETSAPVS